MKQRKMIAKTISWRVLSIVTTVGVVYWYSGSIELSGVVGFTELVFKTGLYYAHERFWHRK